jgi:hypothetical protein
LGEVGAIGVGRDSKIRLVLLVPLKVAINYDEHSPRFQALDKLSNGLGEVCYLKGINISVLVVFENI